ncbi:hypothetical protein NN561_019766 [Cricetulus griseus]
MGRTLGGPLGPGSTRVWSCRRERRSGPQWRGPGCGGPWAPGASGALTGRPRRVIVVGASGGGGGAKRERCARTPGNLAPAAPPLRGAQAPPPRSPPLPACQWVPGQWESAILGRSAGDTGEKLLESLASPEPALGVRLKGCRGSLPGRDVTVSLLVPGHRGGWGSNPLEECAFGSGGGDAATSLLSCCRWCGG